MNTTKSPRTGEDARTGLYEGDTAYLLEMSKGHIAKLEVQNAALVAALEAVEQAQRDGFTYDTAFAKVRAALDAARQKEARHE